MQTVPSVFGFLKLICFFTQNRQCYQRLHGHQLILRTRSQIHPRQDFVPEPCFANSNQVSLKSRTTSKSFTERLQVRVLGRSCHHCQHKQPRQNLGAVLCRSCWLQRLREPKHCCSFRILGCQLPRKRSHQCTIRCSGLQYLYGRQSLCRWSFQRNSLC